MLIRNDAEWNTMIPLALQAVMNDVTEQALNLLKDILQVEVYSKPATNGEETGWYMRVGAGKGDFGTDAWEKSDAFVTGKVVTAEVGYHPESMSVDPSFWQHGSNYWKENDVREYLADWIFKGLPDSMVGEILPRDAWTPFVAQVKIQFPIWWTAACRKHGLPIR